MLIYAIDPGTKKSGYVTLSFKGLSLDFPDPPIRFLFAETLENRDLWTRVSSGCFDIFDFLVIEKIVARKWAGRETSDAAIWSGIFAGAQFRRSSFITRSKVRWHILGEKKGGDAEIKKVILNSGDRWPGLLPELLKRKLDSHQYAALALALTFIDNFSERGLGL